MKPTPITGLAAGLVLTAIVVVLGLAVAGITWSLRSNLRDQILRREGESLYAVTLMPQAVAADRTGGTASADDDEGLVILALQASRLRGVLGVQVFNHTGRPLHTMPTTLQRPPLGQTEWAVLRALHPVVHFEPAASLAALYGLEDGLRELAPLLEISVPLHRPSSTALEGAAYYVIDGELVAREFTLLDRSLAQQAGLVWVLAAGVIVVVVGGMFLRLARAHAALQARTDDLVLANRELSLAAKTSALGAVTAHLVHGLRNPIAGLEAFIDEQRQNESAGPDGAWSEANATALRMRSMINEVVDLLQEEQAGVAYELSTRDVLTTVSTRIAGLAAQKQVAVTIISEDAAQITNHQAGLVAAILSNLAQNACEALPENTGQLTLASRCLKDGAIEFRVDDNGPGLPEIVSANLFMPRQSSKPGGAGIGLAICRQLAVHLGGTLELVTSGATGTSFRLKIPGGRLPRPQFHQDDSA